MAITLKTTRVSACLDGQSSDVISWLVRGDVSVAYQTSRDLLDRPDRALQRRIAREGWGARFLRMRNPDGSWGDRFYRPKWTSSHYTLLDLKNLEVWPQHDAIRQSVRKVVAEQKGPDGSIWCTQVTGRGDVCVNGMFLNYASYFGTPESDLGSVVDFLLEQQMDDGGFNCRSNHSGATHSSVHSTVSVLEGIAEYLRTSHSYRVDDLVRAACEAREFLLQHRLYKSGRTGEVIHPELLRLSYPTRWKYNVLRALDHFRAAGAPWDERMTDALDVVQDKRRRDGRWPLQAAHPGKVHFAMEEPRGPSRWNTLIALRVLRAYGA